MIHAIIQGLVEGITEFLPVSSTAHLIIVGKLLGLPQDDYWKFFEVFIQGGAILAVVVSFFTLFTKKELIPKLVISFLPTAVVGFALYKVIKNFFFENTLLIGAMLIIFGLVFLLVELAIRRKSIVLSKSIIDMSYRDAVLLGLAQSLATIPGVSRAGIVLVAAFLLGYRRKDAALYSFFLAVPTIFAAAGYDLLKTDPRVIFSHVNLSLIGFITAFLTAYVVVRWFIRYLQSNTLALFAWYRIVLGFGVFALYLYGLL